MQQILLSEESVSSCSFFENRHNLIYMYRNFIYISYVCVFTGALLVGCSKQEWEKRSGKRLSFLFLIPSSQSGGSPAVCIPLSPRCVCVLCAGDACTAAADAAALWQDWTPATRSSFYSSLSHLLTPPLAPSPFSLSHSLTGFCGKIVAARCSPSSLLPLCDTNTFLCAPHIFFPICLFHPSSLKSFIPSCNSILPVSPHLFGRLSSFLFDAARLC